MKHIINIDWEDFGILINEFIENLKEVKEEFDSVYGIPRGGNVIAVCVSHHLSLPLVDKDNITSRTLIVDDISDTGKTIIKEGLDENHVATLFTTKWTKHRPITFSGVKSSKDDWLLFPWETYTNETEEINMDDRQTTLDEFE